MPLGSNWSVPELSHLETDWGFPVYHTVEGIAGTFFDIPLVDLEKNDAQDRYRAFSDLLKSIDNKVWLKFSLSVELERQKSEIELSRDSAFAELGAIRKSLRVFIEWKDNSRTLLKKSDRGIVPLDALKQLDAMVATSPVLKDVFLSTTRASSEASTLDTGSQVIGVIRLNRPGTSSIDWATLAKIQDEIPHPYRITCSIRAVPSGKMDLLLRAKMNRDRFSRDVTTTDKLEASADALKEINLNGAQVYEYEWTLVLQRTSESALKTDLHVASRAMSQLGDVYIETFGSIPTFVASLPGSQLHVTHKEINPTILYFLPISTFGSDSTQKYEKKSACLLHRQDGSCFRLDIFNERFLAFNAIITGKTGSGKSVFGNVLSRALLNDERIHLVKVDVGGSYKRECSLYGGREVNFHLDKPSGVDPFTVTKGVLTNEIRSVLTELIATLALDENETAISKACRSEFERAIKEYYRSNPKQPSLSDFITSSERIPRREILSRFAIGGVFENAIRSESDSQTIHRYTYYNFENIHGAANKDYSTGLMAAVIAFVNLEMIRLSNEESRLSGKRLVFFCDETKFFIDRNAPFFLLTTANFRKFGHSVILTGQNIENFFLKTDGGEDRGLILNCPIRIFFENQSREEFLRAEFGFSSRECNAVGRNAYRGRDFRQFVVQDDLGTRIARLFLTRREYWEMTSSRNEVDQLDELKRALPWLNENQRLTIMLMKEAQ